MLTRFSGRTDLQLTQSLTDGQTRVFKGVGGVKINKWPPVGYFEWDHF